MIIEIIVYLILYGCDMGSSLLLMKKKKEVFDNYESNEFFKRIIDTYGIKKGILVYSFSVGIQMLLINLSSMFFAYRYIFGEWNFIQSIELGLIFIAIVHVFGIASNFLGMLKTVKPLEIKK